MFDVFEEVKDCGSIAISGHTKPDGDCIGSCLSLCLYLRKRIPGAKVQVYLEKPSACFNNIPGIDLIDSSFESDIAYDAYIILDSIPSRTGAENLIEKAKKTINIDHHISNAEGSGMVNFIVPEASSTAELIYECIDKSYLDSDIAALIYMGIAHDTGVFRYSNTAPKTMMIVAELIKYDFDFSDLLDTTFFKKTYLQNRVQSQVVIDSTRYYDNRVIVGVADKALMEKYGAKKSDFEGCVELLRLTEGVQIAVLIYEKDDQLSKISLRSLSDELDVSKVAMNFGGGGHVRASGCDYKGDAYEAKEKIVEALASLFENTEN